MMLQVSEKEHALFQKMRQAKTAEERKEIEKALEAIWENEKETDLPFA